MRFSAGLNKIYVPDVVHGLESDINAAVARDEAYYENEIDKFCRSCIEDTCFCRFALRPVRRGKTTTSKYPAEIQEFGHGVSRLR